MKIKISLLLFVLIGAICFIFFKLSLPKEVSVNIDNLNLLDTSMNRNIPVLLYSKKTDTSLGQKVAIVAHGHETKNSDYAYISLNLAMQGYLVASIQYELPEDKEIDISGNIFEALKPSWERSVKSILFVAQYLKEKHPNLDCQNLTLIGHSRGGDIVMLFAKNYPALVSKVISLDNSHMPLPRTKKPQIFLIRSNNSDPDTGVLPTPEEQKQFDIEIVALDDVSHIDMCFGTADQKREINSYITKFIKKN
jgi:Chlorophyllase